MPRTNKTRHERDCQTCECRTIKRRLLDRADEISEAAAETKRIATDGVALMLNSVTERKLKTAKG